MLHCIFFTEVFMAQCRLNAWAHWGNMGAMLIYICCVQHVFLCLNINVVGSTNTINICLFLWQFTFFLTMSGCVGRAPVDCFARGPMMLLRQPWYILCYLLFSLYYWYLINYLSASRRCCDRMVVGFTSTFAIGTYHH